MNQTHEHDHPEQPDSAVPPGVGAGATPDESGDAMTAEQAEDLVDLARSGEADVPVGAEDFVVALRIVAAQRDEHLARFQRAAADFQNFQRRARQAEREVRELTSAGVVQSVLQVVDFFDMALRQDPEKATAAQVIGGVEMIKAEFLRVLGGHGVGLVDPRPGDEFDPTRHEAIEQIPAGEIAPGRVAGCRAPGFTLGDRVIRPAKVLVATAGDVPGTAAGGPGEENG